MIFLKTFVLANSVYLLFVNCAQKKILFSLTGFTFFVGPIFNGFMVFCIQALKLSCRVFFEFCTEIINPNNNNSKYNNTYVINMY